MARSGIMLAKPVNMNLFRKWDGAYVQRKVNGMRLRTVIERSSHYLHVNLYTSESNHVVSVPHIYKEIHEHADFLLNVFNINRLEIDGEVYRHGLPLNVISTIFKRGNVHPQHELLQYHIFDICLDKPQDIRISCLGYVPESNILIPVETFRLMNRATMESEMMELLNAFMQEKYEGIILRKPDSLYERKKTSNIFKIKPRRTDTYQIIGTTEEISIDGEPKNRLGAFICFKDNETFKVGTGFLASDRDRYWQDRKKFESGEYWALVKYPELTGARSVPSCPVFVDVVKP